ncbi:MAG: TIGR03905 family TSCPD domain-containing protein, partial [Bacteroidales bacterium]|nr:TIGR03905 family TSCPD domain-containing protein [Bacteroidales bacterium]
GNLQGICRLVQGQTIDDVIARLDGIRCGDKPTSCPDQLCRALEQLKNK